jgi:hypothetical protein
MAVEGTVDAEDDQAGGRGKLPHQWVMRVDAEEDPAAAIKVDQRRGRSPRCR